MGVLDMWPLALCVLQVLIYFVVAIILIILNEYPRPQREEEHEEVEQYAEEVTSNTVVLRRETWEAWAGRMHPGWLLAVRISGFFYLLGLLFMVYFTRQNWVQVYKFYTEWSLTLLIIYFGLASYVSIIEMVHSYNKKHSGNGYYSRRHEVEEGLLGKDGDSEDQKFDKRPGEKELDPYASTENPQEKAGYLGYLLQGLFQTVAPAVVLTDGVYWTFLYPFFPENFPHTWSEWNLHAVNAVFLLAELFLNSMRYPWFRGAYFFLYSCFYTFVQWGLVYFYHIPWAYPFMAVGANLAPVWYLVVGLLHLTAYAIVTFLDRAKLTLQNRDIEISGTSRFWSWTRSWLPGQLLRL